MATLKEFTDGQWTLKSTFPASILRADGGTTDHSQLTNRDANDQHPISAITGLGDALDGKIDNPAIAGTAGQVLGLDDNLAPIWLDQSGGSNNPIEVSSLDEMTDITKKYAYDGWVYQYEEVFTPGDPVPNFTNLLPTSIGVDGNVFNGVGYREGYRLNSSAVETAQEEAWVSGYIPCAVGDVFRFEHLCDDISVGGLSVACNVVFFETDKTTTINVKQLVQVYNGSTVDFMTAVFDEETHAVVSVTIVGASYWKNLGYVRFTGGRTDPDDCIITRNEEITYSPGGTTEYQWVRKYEYVPGEDRLETIENRVSAVESAAQSNATGLANLTQRVNQSIGDPGVLGKYAAQIDRALTAGYISCNYLGDKEMLSFLHISDTHGSVNVSHAVEILNKLHTDGRCSFMIHTGDWVSSHFGNDFEQFAGYVENAEAPVLMVSGNHDVGNNATDESNVASDSQFYTRFFAPFIDDWGLTSHPSGKNYWYKDFSDAGVRLIGLYDFESDYAPNTSFDITTKIRGRAAYRQAQIDWFIQALMTCPADYGVIIAKHNPANKRGTLDNPFNSRYLQGRNTSQTYISNDCIPDIVQAFIDGASISKTYAQSGGIVTTLTVSADFSNKNSGAEFVCYLNGHTHADGVNFLADYPDQLELNVGCDNSHYQHYSDTLNQAGTLHEDLLNYVTVDRNRGYVYIQRIGNDYSAHADRRDFTAINYRGGSSGADSKLDKNVGSTYAGDFLVVGSDGNITHKTMTAWQGGDY